MPFKCSSKVVFPEPDGPEIGAEEPGEGALAVCSALDYQHESSLPPGVQDSVQNQPIDFRKKNV